jgi:hypothetical protein
VRGNVLPLVAYYLFVSYRCVNHIVVGREVREWSDVESVKGV